MSAEELNVYTGGKGLNQSIALSRAGMETYHAGAIGMDGLFLLDQLKEAGVNTDLVKILEDVRTGNAIIQNDEEASQPSRSSRLGRFQGEGDTSPGVASAVLIADMVIRRQPPGPDVQPHSQGVGLHVGLERRRQLRGRTAPGGPVRRHKGGNGL